MARSTVTPRCWDLVTEEPWPGLRVWRTVSTRELQQHQPLEPETMPSPDLARVRPRERERSLALCLWGWSRFRMVYDQGPCMDGATAVVGLGCCRRSAVVVLPPVLGEHASVGVRVHGQLTPEQSPYPAWPRTCTQAWWDVTWLLSHSQSPSTVAGSPSFVIICPDSGGLVTWPVLIALIVRVVGRVSDQTAV